MFPAPFVCINMAELNVDDPSFWFNDVLAARDEDEAIVDECYEAATDASDYAGSISEGDSDPDHVELCDDQPEFCDDQRDSEFFDGVGAEAVEVPEYVPPDDVPLDDEAAKEKAARYEQTKRLFNRGKGARNAVGKVERYTPPIHIKRRAVAMIEAGHTLEEVRQHVWDVTREKVYLLNQRQLNGWAKTVQTVEGLVLPRGTKRISGGGRKAQFHEVDHDLWKWFCDRRAQNLPLSSQLLKKTAGDFASENGRRVSAKWIECFRRRHRIVLRKSQRRSQLSNEERENRLNKFYSFLYLQPTAFKVFVNYDEMPGSLAGMMGQATTLEHCGTENVILSIADQHFKRMGTLIPIIGVRKDGDALAAVDFDPAIILKCHTQKVIANPHQLLVVSNATGVINSVFMRDKFLPYLVAQLQKVPGEARIVMDSASAHISAPVLAAFRAAGLSCAVIPGGLTFFIQAVDVFLTFLYRTCHHQLYLQMAENKKK